MLGTAAKPVLHAKAKECQGLLDFVVELIDMYLPQIRGANPEDAVRAELLLTAGKHALRFEQLISELPRVVSPEQRHTLWSSYLSHVTCFQRAGGDLKPKAHAMSHMLQRTLTLGSPRFYHTYRDESLNRVIANIAARSHRMLFATSIFARFAVMQELGMRNAIT